MFKTLSRLFRLKPYGNQLVDGMAELWLLLAALNIAAIAICDAVAWGYFGYTTAHGMSRWIAAVLAFVIVVTLVGSLDAMFVMHDRSRRRHDRSLLHKDNLAIAARVVLVVLTFTVTAPFLTQLFFARDIEANISRKNERTVAARRQAIADSFDRRAASVRGELVARQRDLEQEIAGSGASRRYGRGPTATAISSGITTLQSELAALADSRARELESFDDAAKTPALLASRYGVDLVREGPAIRARVIEELEESPAFRSTQRTIKAFLVFMFLGLVCLKLFQPESVRIYYSARLQAAFARLKAGVFDHRLDPAEGANGAAMTPVRFADWYENDQADRDVTDRLRDQTALAIERLKAQEDAVRVLQNALRVDIARMNDDLSAAAKVSDDLEQELAAAQHELDVLTAKINEGQQQVADFSYDVTDDLSLRDQQMLISSRNKTVRNLGEHRAAAAKLSTTVRRLSQRLEANRELEEGLRAAMTSSGTEAAVLAKALQDARQRRLGDILAAS